jgi:hypothetical protein
VANEWIGRAGAVTQVTVLTVTGAGTGTGTLGVVVGPKTVNTATANAMTAATFAAALFANLSASTEPEVSADLSFTYNTGDAFVTATGRTPGQPVTIMPGGAVTSNGLTVTPATTAATGPNDAANPANWSAGVIPAGPALIRSGPNLLYNLDTGLAGASSLDIWAAWTNGRVGLPDRNPAGYREYRPVRGVMPAASTLRVGVGAGGGGPSLVRMTFAGVNSALWVFATGSPDAGEVAAVDVNGVGLFRVEVSGGSCVLNRDSAAAAGTVHMVGGRLVMLNGTTATSCDVDGGRLDLDANFAACVLKMSGGETHVIGGTQSQWDLTGGTVFAEWDQPVGSGKVLVHAAGPGGGKPAPVVDFSHTPGTVTLNNGSYFTGGAALKDPGSQAKTAGTDTVTFDAASLAASDLGPSVTITRP